MKQKYLMKMNASGWKWVLTGIVLPVIAVALMMIMPRDAGQDQEMLPADLPAETAQAAEGTVAEEPAEDMSGDLMLVRFENGEIQTPYLTLNYPESFEDYLLIVNSSRDPYILEFYAVLPEKLEQRIFDICLGVSADGNLGVVTTEAGEIPVGMTVYSFAPDNTWNDAEIDTILAMQEATNDLLLALDLSANTENENSPVIKEAPDEAVVVNYLQIETPYCMLYYPGVWAERLRTEQVNTEEGCKVEFYCSLEGREPLLMFTVLFGGDEGEQLGAVTSADGITLPVYILVNVPSEEGLQEEERNTLYSMQEALNLMIQQLPLK